MYPISPLSDRVVGPLKMFFCDFQDCFCWPFLPGWYQPRVYIKDGVFAWLVPTQSVHKGWCFKGPDKGYKSGQTTKNRNPSEGGGGGVMDSKVVEYRPYLQNGSDQLFVTLYTYLCIPLYANR